MSINNSALMNNLINNIQKLEKENKKLKSENERLKLLKNNGAQFNHRSSHFSVTRQQQWANKRAIRQKFIDINRYLFSIGLHVEEISIFKADNDNYDDKNLKLEIYDEINKEDVLKQLLYFKDRYNVSDHIMEQFLTKIVIKKHYPNIKELKCFRNEYNKRLHILPKQNGIVVEIIERIEVILKKVHKTVYTKENSYDTFTLKFCADSTNVGRNLKLLNFNFSVLNEKIKSKTAFGHYTLGIFEILEENSTSLHECLSEAFHILDTFETIKIEENNFKIKKYVGGDWKFLADCVGINAASSDYSCIWCTCKKENFHDFEKVWSIKNTLQGARNILESRLRRVKSTVDAKLGYIREPISVNIPFYDHILDMLHLFLRIGNVLISLFFYIKLLKLENLMKNDFPIQDTKFISKLENFFLNDCKIRKAISSSSSGFDIRDFRGPELHKIFKKINIPLLFPELEDKDDIQSLLNTFYEIYTLVKGNKLDSTQVRARTNVWLQMFLNLYHFKHVTPYMHAFTFHLHEFIEYVGDVNAFNQEGHEKLNDLTTVQYYRGTNKHDDYLKQMLLKRLRIEDLI